MAASEEAGTDGRPKAGYALAAAVAGDPATAIWALRRSLRMDPDALRYLALVPELHETIDGLISAYEANAYEGTSQRDSAFMRAAFRYVRRDVQGARAAIEVARDAGDRSPSTVNLGRLICELERENHDANG